MEVFLFSVLLGQRVPNHIITLWEIPYEIWNGFLFPGCPYPFDIEPTSDCFSAISIAECDFVIRNVGDFENNQGVLSDFDFLDFFRSSIVKQD